MYELNRISNNTYYFSGPTKIGLYRLSSTDVCIIDTGIEERVGKRILKTVNENGWKIKFVINTHAHADHVGGNAYIQGETGCEIFANPIEACFTEHPFLNSCFVYGAFSPKELRKKFMLAKKSIVRPITELNLPEGFEIIDLSGHSSEMIGVRTPDDVLFLADSIVSREIIEKYTVTYIFNVQKYIDTLERVKDMQAGVFVPAHADICEDISALAEYNISVTNGIAESILSMCEKPISFENLLKTVFEKYSLKLDHEQYALIGGTVKSYLTYLSDKELLGNRFEDGVLLFFKV